MPNQLDKCCMTCEYSRRMVIEKGFSFKRINVGLVCWIDDDEKCFVNATHVCPGWEPKEVEQ